MNTSKFTITIVLATLSLAVVGPALPPSGNVTLAWDYPPHGQEITFNLYQSATIFPPVWTLVTNTTAQQVTIRATRSLQFFAVTAVVPTNIWLESDFSNVLSLPAQPSTGSNLRATLAP